MEARNYIGGVFISLKDEGSFVYNPSNLEEKVGIMHYSDVSQVSKAEAMARVGFQQWSKQTGNTRGSFLYKMANALEKNADSLAGLASREMGKPITEMKGEVNRGVQLLRYYAGEGVRSIGQVIPSADVDVLQYSVRVPLGVVGVITPWNFPVAIPIWKIAPALMCGNTVIWKPADIASLTATRLMEIFEEAQLPSGVLNMIVGKGSKVGNALIEEGDLQAISFTGSTAVGTHVASVCAKRNIKYQTEMGGKNAAVVLADADLEKTIPMIISGAFRSAGQKCTATSRIIVEKAIYTEFIDRLKGAVEQITVTEALHPNAYLGPVASRSQYESVCRYVELAREQAEVVAEAELQNNHEGYYIPPLVVTGVEIQHELFQDEIFGPLSVVVKASDYDEAVNICNDSMYGLSASLFTSDLSKAHRFLEEVEAGMVRVNQETAGVEYQAPFGGMKMSSSHTREQGQVALDFYSTTKTCAIKHTL